MCYYQATRQSTLKTHKKSVHDSEKYCCNQCDYHAKTKSSLKANKKSVHDGMKYFCDKYDNQTG